MNNSFTEKKVKNVRVYGKNVSGCIIHNKKVMVSYTTTEKKSPVIDLFLTSKQAKDLIVQLTNTLKENKE
jgi:hypothetical protein